MKEIEMSRIILKISTVVMPLMLIGCGGGMDDIYKQVSDDSVKQYNIAKRQGDKIQICVQAGLVSASYLQANDEENYGKWKSIEKADCERAGIVH